MATPLLAPNDDNDHPSLSEGPLTIENESMELIASLVASSQQPLDPLEQRQLEQPAVEAQAETDYCDVDAVQSLCTIAAGTLALVHVAFVWASYITSPWSETHVVITISWLQNLVSTFTSSQYKSVDRVAQQIDIGSTFALFVQTNQYALLFLLIITSTILPCIAILIYPLAIKAAHHGKDEHNAIILRKTPLICFELSMRAGSFVVYVLTFVDLATSFIELDWTDTRIEIHNRLGAGLVSYVIGTSAAMGSVFFLRLSRSRKWTKEQENESTKPLLGSAFSFYHNTNGQASYLSLEQEIPTEEIPPEAVSNEAGTKNKASSVCGGLPERIVAWEFGLAAVLLWIPTLTLPLFQVSYSGIAASFMPAKYTTVFFLHIPGLVWQRGLAAGTDRLWLLIVSLLCALQVFLIPLAVFATCVGVWFGSERCRKWLYCLYPNSNGITFAIALLLTVHALDPISSSLVNESYDLCQQFDNLLGEACLNLSGTILTGAWVCMGQAVSLEIFILLTLRTFPR